MNVLMYGSLHTSMMSGRLKNTGCDTWTINRYFWYSIVLLDLRKEYLTVIKHKTIVLLHIIY